MSGDAYEFTSIEQASAAGLDARHTMEHMVETVLCALNGNVEALDTGFFFSFVDVQERTWTLSVLPDGESAVSRKLLERAMEGDEG